METITQSQRTEWKPPQRVDLAFIDEYKFSSHQLPTIKLNSRQICDLELILNGGFAPLHGFLNKADYDSVLQHMRLADGALWPIPITLDVDNEFAEKINSGDEVALRDAEGVLLAILVVEDKWVADKDSEARHVYGTLDEYHPGVAYLKQQTKDIYLGGKLIGVSLPAYYDFNHLRFTPEALREEFQRRGWKKIVAFQTRNPMHRAHQELTARAMAETGANLLIHPVVGVTKPGDIEYYTRVRCYEHVLPSYPENTAMLSLLPLAMRMAGPREAVWHAIIRRNYGCTHFIVGRDHAGPGKDRKGNDFYSPYAAQELVMKHQQEIGISIVPFQEMAYSHRHHAYFPMDQFPADEKPGLISGTELRDRLQKNLDIPEWFSYPAVLNELQKSYPPKHKQGFTVFFTGLPSAGKSTLANALMQKLREFTDRHFTLLDGDIIRTHLSRGLGFSQEDREANITRVGFVAREVTKHGGIAICALVAPYVKPRGMVRDMVKEVGGFIEVYVSTPLTVCETRDRKGLYKKAREGFIKQFTGISDPYEPPVAPEVTVDTVSMSPEQIIDVLVSQLKSMGYIG